MANYLTSFSLPLPITPAQEAWLLSLSENMASLLNHGNLDDGEIDGFEGIDEGHTPGGVRNLVENISSGLGPSDMPFQTHRLSESLLYVTDADGSCDLEHLVVALEALRERFGISEPWAFQYANTCSTHRSDGFGGGFIVLGPGETVWQDTQYLMNEALRGFAPPQASPVDMAEVEADSGMSP